jgi:hypothetical protein
MTVAQAAALVPNNTSLELGTSDEWEGYGFDVTGSVKTVLTLDHYGTYVAFSIYTETFDGSHWNREGKARLTQPLPANADKSFANASGGGREKILLTTDCFEHYNASYGYWSNLVVRFKQPVQDNPDCAPTTCAAERKNCGSIADGCGGTLSCGTCGDALYCNSVNVCEAPFCCGAYTYPARDTSSGQWSCFYSDLWPTGGCVNR